LGFFVEGLAIIKTRLTENEENESCGKSSDLQTRFCSFLVRDPLEEATKLARNGPKFPLGR
jgi:hypothetical protein